MLHSLALLFTRASSSSSSAVLFPGCMMSDVARGNSHVVHHLLSFLFKHQFPLHTSTRPTFRRSLRSTDTRLRRRVAPGDEDEAMLDDLSVRRLFLCSSLAPPLLFLPIRAVQVFLQAVPLDVVLRFRPGPGTCHLRALACPCDLDSFKYDEQSGMPDHSIQVPCISCSRW